MFTSDAALGAPPFRARGRGDLRPWALLNITLAGGLMALSIDTILPPVIGAFTLFVAAWTGAGRAWRRVAIVRSSGRRGGALDRLLAYDVLLAWFPGFVALALAAAAVVVMASQELSSPMRWLALGLFVYQIAVIAALEEPPLATVVPVRPRSGRSA